MLKQLLLKDKKISAIPQNTEDKENMYFKSNIN